MPTSGEAPANARTLKEEIIGTEVTIVATNHPPLARVHGEVVDETQRTLVVATTAGERRVPKVGQTFRFERPDGTTFTVAGRRIAYRPADRLKKAR